MSHAGTFPNLDAVPAKQMHRAETGLIGCVITCEYRMARFKRCSVHQSLYGCAFGNACRFNFYYTLAAKQLKTG